MSHPTASMPTRPLTHDELDRAVRQLNAIGGLYELIALIVEAENRPYCTPTDMCEDCDGDCRVCEGKP